MSISLTVIPLLEDECFLHLDAAFVLIVLIKLYFVILVYGRKFFYIEFQSLDIYFYKIIFNLGAI